MSSTNHSHERKDGNLGLLDDHRKWIEEKRKDLHAKVELAKMESQFETERTPIMEYRVYLISDFDEQEFVFIGSFGDMLARLLDVVDKEQIQSIVIRVGGDTHV